MANDTLEFHVPFTAAAVDFENKVVRGMSLITGDIEAEGHGLHVDDTTLKQIFEWAKRHGQVTVKCDHKGADGKTFKAICGYLENFALDLSAKKVRGDLHLLHEDSETPKILEMAKRMPKNFGLSVAFKGKGVPGKGKIQLARCEKLISADLVENPAANPDGAFSVPKEGAVDSGANRMAETNNNPQGEPTLADIFNLVKQQGDQINAIAQQQKAQQETIDAIAAGGDEAPLTQEELDNISGMTDAQLAELGITRAEVEAAVAEANAAGEGAGAEGTDAGAPAGANAAPGTVGAALNAMYREIVALKSARSRDIALAEKAEVDHAFSVVETKVVALAEQNDGLVTQLAAKEAEIVSLRAVIKTGRGGAGVKPGVEATLFTAKAEEKGGEFEKIVTTKFEELKKQDGMTEVKAKSQAVQFGIQRHPEAYAEFRERGGKTVTL